MKKTLQKRLAFLAFLLGVGGSALAQGSVQDSSLATKTNSTEDIGCVDGNGTPIPSQLIWQEDFGTFTSDSTYWTWDYSDLNAPKKVTHNDGKEWTSCFGLSIPGAECDKSPSVEGKYTVAGNVTCQYDGVTGGTQWGWEAICFNGKYPRENSYTFVPDHTYQGSAFGGMLFLNCGNEPNEIIYSKRITSSILKDQNVTARCFVNTFSDAINPVEIYIQLTDMKTGNVTKSTTVIRDSKTDGLEWKQANVRSFIEGDSILIEVVSVGGGNEYNKNGNDLILDDIQLYICEGETDIPGCTQPKEPVIYANGKDVKSIHLKSGESVTLTSNDVTATDKDGNPYTNYTMSWHNGNEESAPIKKTVGVVADSLVVSWEDATTNGTTFILKVQDNVLDANGERINDCNTYDTITVYADADTTPEIESYCLDGNGNKIPQILLWQEDFGTFTSDSTYWSWDYSDLDAPKKVTHNDAKKWSTCYGLEIPRTECTPSPFDQGSFTVAGNVTSSADEVGGTQWGYESMCFNGKYPSENGFTFVPDHTYQGSAFGGMLFVNGDSEIGEVIYSKKISSSKLKGRDVTARCFVNTFADAPHPVKIHIQITDLKTGGVAKSTTITRNSQNEGLDWKEATVTSSIEGDSVLVEVVYDCGDSKYNLNGNDLILDDIQVFVCEGESDLPNCIQSKEPIIYANGKDVKSIHLSPDESVTLTSNDVTTTDKDGNPYTNYTMSWHKGNEGSAPIKKTVGVVADSLVVSWEDATTNGTTFILKVQDNVLDANGERINDCNTYDTITVYADADTTPEIESYCLDGNGNKIPQILLWQEDFGTFTSDSTYWTWDYSDLNAPKKVTHNDGKEWTSCFDLNIPGTECDIAPSIEGKYTVAGNVTCSYDGVQGGTQWGWEAICFNGKYPRENGYTFVPDHTYQGSDFGGMLFINGGNETNEVIYAKQISNSILKNKNVSVKCYVNTFADAVNPVKVFIRLTDLSSGASVTSEPVTRNTKTDGLAWHEAAVSTVLDGNDILVEIINAVGGDDYNKKGNDLILDDIRLYVCDDSEHVGVETQSVEEMDELVNVYTISGIIVKSNVKRSEALNGLKKGTYYIVGHEKVLIDL